jgi:hypothetical protein
MVLREGADPNSTNLLGDSCLAVAGLRNRDGVIKALSKHGAKLNAADERIHGLHMSDLERRARCCQTTQYFEQHEGSPISDDTSAILDLHHILCSIVRYPSTGMPAKSEYIWSPEWKQQIDLISLTGLKSTESQQRDSTESTLCDYCHFIVPQ